MEDDGVRAAVVYQQHALHTLIGSHAKLDGAGVHRHGREPRSAIHGTGATRPRVRLIVISPIMQFSV